MPPSWASRYSVQIHGSECLWSQHSGRVLSLQYGRRLFCWKREMRFEQSEFFKKWKKCNLLRWCKLFFCKNKIRFDFYQKWVCFQWINKIIIIGTHPCLIYDMIATCIYICMYVYLHVYIYACIQIFIFFHYNLCYLSTSLPFYIPLNPPSIFS